jgi:hypothetical protein
MKSRDTFGCLLSLLVAGLNAQADVVTDWNEAALNAIRAQNTSPPAASRNLAILHLAIYDAVNGIARTHEPYLAHAVGAPPASASRDAAASTAAYQVMSALYPTLQTNHDALYQTTLGTIPDRPQKTQGVRWGEKAAAAILAARSHDGSTNTAPFPGSMEPGKWRPTISFGGIVRPALLPLWSAVTPFVMQSGTQLRPPAPPPLSSHEYAENLNQVKAYGSATSTVRTEEQTQIALFWSYGPTTATPPGHWNEIATSVSLARDLSLEENARLYALLNVAMADAGIACWDCKYSYNLWRPITAIALADTDDNPETAPDPAWVPLLATPPFPEYTSGHSTFSGAAAATMALFFGTDDIAFTVGSDDLPGVQRSYQSFSAAAEESGMSRILGGIHYMVSNRHGLNSGAAIGELVATRYLRPKGNLSRHR